MLSRGFDWVEAIIQRSIGIVNPCKSLWTGILSEKMLKNPPNHSPKLPEKALGSIGCRKKSRPREDMCILTIIFPILSSIFQSFTRVVPGVLVATLKWVASSKSTWTNRSILL